MPDNQMGILQELVATVRERPKVLEEWGVGKKLASSAGVTVLFAGPPGTGKTMAAEVIAAELGLDLYKIDLSTRGQQVHRRDREEPGAHLHRGARAATPSSSSTRPTRSSASAPRSRTPTTATPTSRSATCCSAWRPTTA